MKISTLFFSIILIYLIIVAYMYLNQRKLLYLPSENNYLDDQIDFNFREVFIDVEKNLKLKAWLIENDFKNKKTLVFFHGNAGNLSNRTYKLNQLSKLDLNIIILAWRSFSGNEGEPSEQNLYNDAKKTMNFTAIYISHDLALVKYVCERTIVMYLGSIVEDGPTKDVISNPLHPYTKALVKAVPVPHVNQSHDPLPILGNIPDATKYYKGCKFSDRCPNPTNDCKQQNTKMGLVEVKPGHWVDRCCANCV